MSDKCFEAENQSPSFTDREEAWEVEFFGIGTACFVV
jgi:hypothetical protein